MDVFSFVIASDTLASLCRKLAHGGECPPDRLQLSMEGKAARQKVQDILIKYLHLNARSNLI